MPHVLFPCHSAAKDDPVVINPRIPSIQMVDKRFDKFEIPAIFQTLPPSPSPSAKFHRFTQIFIGSINQNLDSVLLSLSSLNYYQRLFTIKLFGVCSCPSFWSSFQLLFHIFLFINNELCKSTVCHHRNVCFRDWYHLFDAFPDISSLPVAVTRHPNSNLLLWLITLRCNVDIQTITFVVAVN